MKFEDSEYQETVLKSRDFMFGDIEKSIDLAWLKYPDDKIRGAPNFLIALGLSCYTEAWGKLLQGIARGKSQICYESFIRKLGPEYGKLLDRKYPVYDTVRCGLAHAYLMNEDGMVNLGTGTSGIEVNGTTNHYTFNIQTYFKDFKIAVDQYISGLKNGTEDVDKMNKSLLGKPKLI
jgi:hypothetical protein